MYWCTRIAICNIWNTICYSQDYGKTWLVYLPKMDEKISSFLCLRTKINLFCVLYYLKRVKRNLKQFKRNVLQFNKQIMVKRVLTPRKIVQYIWDRDRGYSNYMLLKNPLIRIYCAFYLYSYFFGGGGTTIVLRKQKCFYFTSWKWAIHLNNINNCK